MLKTWKTLNLLNYELEQHSAAGRKTLIACICYQYYKTGYIYALQKLIISQCSIII